MTHGQKWAAGLGIAAAVLGVMWLAVAWWLPSDEDLAARLTAEAEARLGVKVTIGAAHWALLPTPVIVINGLRTQQAPPVVIGQLSAYPKLRELLRRKLVFARIDLDDAVFPPNAMHGFLVHAGAREPDVASDAPLEHLAFRNLTWISYSGIAVAYEGEIDFDPHWRPRHMALRVPGPDPAFTLTLTRDADADRWQTRVHTGGGTAHGHLALNTDANGAMQLRGQLAPQNIEVAGAMSTFNRRSPVGGKGSGQTVLTANGKSLGELLRSLHTRTTFSVNSATVLRFDLHKAISTHGKAHNGQTALQALTGQMDTQNTDKGMRVTYTGLQARAGKYTATGTATIYRRHIGASGNLYLIEGATGVPFTVSGPIDKPKALMPPGIFAGAAIGTAVLPGIGTSIGAGIGGALGRLFKGSAQPPDVSAPVAPRKN